MESIWNSGAKRLPKPGRRLLGFFWFGVWVGRGVVGLADREWNLADRASKTADSVWGPPTFKQRSDFLIPKKGNEGTSVRLKPGCFEL
jgi:hypothetical protein